MYYIVALMLIGVLFFLTILQVQIKIRIKNKTSYSLLFIRLFKGLICFRFNFALSSSDKGAISLVLKKFGPDYEEQTRIEEILIFIFERYEKYANYADDISYLTSKATIRKLNADIHVGLEDAAQTALISGVIMTTLNFLDDYLKKKFKIGFTYFRISPHYNIRKFDALFNCIFNIRLGHIIIIGVKMLFRNIKAFL